MAITKGNFTQPSSPQSGFDYEYDFTHDQNTGDDGLLTVAVVCDDSDDITGITYDGVSMTEAGQNTLGTNNSLHLFYLEGPSTGSNTVTVTCDGQFKLLRIYALSFTGANAGRTDTIPNDSSSPLAYNFTGTKANSFLYGMVQWDQTGGSTTVDFDGSGGKEYTLQHVWSVFGCVEGPLSSGTRTFNSTWTTGGNQAGLVFEIEEAGGAPPAGPTLRRNRCIVV